MNDVQRKKLDKLAKALSGVTPERLDTIARKTERLGIRVTAADKADIEATAKDLGLGITEYLTALHWFAVDALRTKKR